MQICIKYVNCFQTFSNPSSCGFQAGEAYFVSDGKPVNNFEFFRPLVCTSVTSPQDTLG